MTTYKVGDIVYIPDSQWYVKITATYDATESFAECYDVVKLTLEDHINETFFVYAGHKMIYEYFVDVARIKPYVFKTIPLINRQEKFYAMKAGYRS